MDLLVQNLKEKDILPILCSYPMFVSKENYKNYPEIILDNRRFCIEYSVSGMIDISKAFDNALEDMSKSHNIPYIDLNKTLNHDKKYFADNVHYTDEGAHIVAKTIYNFLKKESIID